MSQSNTVDFPPAIDALIRKFNLSKKKAQSVTINGKQSIECPAIVFKINKQKLVLEEVEQFDDIEIGALAEEELPENSPRYVLISYKIDHSDGRTSYPLVFLNWAPTSSEMGMMTLHASALRTFQEKAGVSKAIDVRDGAEGLSKEAIDAQLGIR